jgi:hypothetical protein
LHVKRIAIEDLVSYVYIVKVDDQAVNLHQCCGVLMGVEIVGNTKGHNGFRQVQPSRRIIILCHMVWCIMICWVQYPSAPPFIC